MVTDQPLNNSTDIDMLCAERRAQREKDRIYAEYLQNYHRAKHEAERKADQILRLFGGLQK